MNRYSVNYYFVDRVVEERYRFLFISYIDFDNKIFLLSTFSRDTMYINSSKIDLTISRYSRCSFSSLLYVAHIILIVLILFHVSLGLV